nr:hypothetical protein [Nocardioides lianchengensis]
MSARRTERLRRELARRTARPVPIRSSPRSVPAPRWDR